MIAYVASPSMAARLCASIASALGYPIPSRCAATGEIDPGAPVTAFYVEPLLHPTDATRVAVPVDEAIREIEHPEVVAAVAAAVELGPEWDPPRRYRGVYVAPLTLIPTDAPRVAALPTPRGGGRS